MVNFDEIVDRRGISAQKWDDQGGEYIPMWVADMDFRIPGPITEALKARIDKGTFGFSYIDDEMYRVISRHYREQYHCEVERDWIVFVPSVMPGANLACRMTGGDIMLNTPMYPHIRRLPQEAHTGVREVPLKETNGFYEMDFEAMEEACDENVTVFVMSNPHNPVGRVFTREELEQLEEFCRRHHLLMVSDEIHCDLVFEGEHIPYFSLSEEAKQNSITLTSGSKTYKIPAIPYAIAIIPNPELRKRYQDICYGLFSPVSVLGVEALKAGYGRCEEWRRELIDYLRANRDYMEERIAAIDGLSVVHNQATYLAWIDCRKLGVESPQKFFLKEAGVNFNDGADFAEPEFVRINFGCPRSQLKEALDRVEAAVKKRKEER